jgi:hypothetical protein
VSYPPHLLDELARVFAEAALDQLLKERAAREPPQRTSAEIRDGSHLHQPTIVLPMEMIVANIVADDQTQSGDMPSKPINVKQVLVYLTPEQHAALHKLKEKVGVPVSESIRRAIDRYLKHLESRK